MPRHIAYKLPMSALDVVVVDDNQPMRQILHSIVTAFGVMRFRSYADGESALLEIADDPPNLVITDWHMKPVNGYQLVRAMRHKSSTTLSLVPVIMLTGFASRGFVQKSFDAGVQQFLVKPVSPNALLKRIKWTLHDGRELILKDRFYVCEQDLALEDEKTIKERARNKIRLAHLLASRGGAPEAANNKAQIRIAAKTMPDKRSHAEHWEI